MPVQIEVLSLGPADTGSYFRKYVVITTGKKIKSSCKALLQNFSYP